MFRLLLSILCCCLFAYLPAQTPKANAKPKLVVGIVVDQMRYDYLYRFYDRFCDGGFKRLMKEGFNFRNCNYNYVPTYTGPGHSCIYTGTTPSVNGITSNDWYDRTSKHKIYCAEDANVQSVGSASAEGQRSPHSLMSSTITDELRLATNFRAKTIGVAIKDRSSILPAGHAASAAYWYDGKTGNMITSTFYATALPDWVKAFNDKHLTQTYLSQKWETLYPIADYARWCSPDSVPYEAMFKGEKSPVFPHDLPNIKANYTADLLRNTPFGNTFTKEFAVETIKNENMGKGSETDFLALSFSCTDLVGHQFGVRSVELADTYFRLDKDLSDFLSFLDQYVGKGQYTVFLTADHGGADNYGFAKEHRLPGGFFDAVKADSLLRAYSTNTFGMDLIEIYADAQIFLDHNKIATAKLNPETVERSIADYALTLPHVAQAVTESDLRRNTGNKDDMAMARRGFYPRRSGDIAMIFDPGYTESSYPKGTTHGVGHSYDTHVPCLFFGEGIPHGECVAPVHVEDIAPTMAILLNTAFPSGTTGEPLNDYMVIKKAK